MKIFILILLYIQSSVLSGKLETQLILSFLKDNDCSLSYFLFCSSKTNIVSLQQSIFQFPINSRVGFILEKTLLSINLAHYNKICFILDVQCKKPSVFKEIKMLKLFRFIYKWLMIYNSNSNKTNDENRLMNAPLRMDAEITVAIPFKANNLYKLYWLYNPGTGSLNIMNEIGTFNGQFQFYENKTFYQFRRNMTGVVLNATTVLTFNFTGDLLEYMLDRRYQYIDVMSKFHYKIFLILREVHHFEYNLSHVDAWYGNATNGMDNGVARLLYEEKIDIAATAAVKKIHTAECIDFLPVYYRFNPCFVFRNPGIYNPWSNEVLKPFSAATWYTMIGFLIVLCVCIKYFNSKERQFHGKSSSYSWIFCILITSGAITQQGGLVTPKYFSSKLVLLSLLVLSLLLYNYYTSALVSALLQTEAPKLTTLTDMMDSQLKLGAEDQPYFRTYLITIKEPEIIRLNHTKVDFMPIQEGIKKIYSGEYAYHAEAVSIYPRISKMFDAETICELGQIEMFPHAIVGIIIPKKSQYKELFSITLSRFINTGVYQRELLLGVAEKPVCFSNKKILSVTINQIFLVYVIWFCGLLFSTSILCLEMYSKYKIGFSKRIVKK